MTGLRNVLGFALVSGALAAQAQAQPSTGERPLSVVAVPAFPTPRNESTDGGDTGVIGIQIATQIATDLRQSGTVYPLGPDGLGRYSPQEAAAPNYRQWQSSAASSLVTGYVERRGDGRLTIVCYVYDLKSRRETGRKGFVVAAKEWRRAAHRCADSAFGQATGKAGHFDTRVAYVAQTGSRVNQVKRLALMDFDGFNHRYLTAGETTVLSPRFSPDGRRIAYVGFTGGQASIRILDVASGADRPLLAEAGMSFSPAFSPDGRQIAFSMASGGNSDIYLMDVDGGYPRQLTNAPGSDIGPSFSPDGRQIVFESSRSGSQQIYVMNSDGSDQRRISFGGGAFASPAWSPSGDSIAFTRLDGANLRVGVMDSDGRNEKILSSGWQDESPAWSPNGEFILFQRTERGSGRSSLFMVSAAGGEARRLGTPQDASDPSWSPPGN